MKHTRILLTLTLALTTVAAAQAPAPLTPAAPATPMAPADVPANHWARDAIALLIKRGVILGYPDGTFKGDSTITRYEIAVTLARILQQNLLATPSAQQALTPADLDVIAKGVKEMSDQITTIDVRLRDALTDIDSIKARLTNTELALQQVIAVAVTKTELEAATQKMNSDTQTALASKADNATVTALQAQVDALTKTVQDNKAATDTKLDGLDGRLNTADTAAKTVPGTGEQAALQNAAAINGQTFTDPAKIPNATFRPDTYSDNPLYVGGGANFPLSGTLGYSAVVGSDRVIAGLGLRASGSYYSKSRAYSIQANVTKTFKNTADGTTKFSPYLGLGGGVLISPNRDDNNVAANDTFLSALGGVNYNFTDTLRLYTELDARYFLSGQGLGTGFDTARKGLGLNIAAGLKVYF